MISTFTKLYTLKGSMRLLFKFHIRLQFLREHINKRRRREHYANSTYTSSFLVYRSSLEQWFSLTFENQCQATYASSSCSRGNCVIQLYHQLLIPHTPPVPVQMKFARKGVQRITLLHTRYHVHFTTHHIKPRFHVHFTTDPR